MKCDSKHEDLQLFWPCCLSFKHWLSDWPEWVPSHNHMCRKLTHLSCLFSRQRYGIVAHSSETCSYTACSCCSYPQGHVANRTRALPVDSGGRGDEGICRRSLRLVVEAYVMWRVHWPHHGTSAWLEMENKRYISVLGQDCNNSSVFATGWAISYFFRTPGKNGNIHGKNYLGRNRFLPLILEEIEETKNSCNLSILASWSYPWKKTLIDN